MTHDLTRLFEQLTARVNEAEQRHGAFASFHEAESVIREECTEFAHAIHLRDSFQVWGEAMDIATAALRFLSQYEENSASFSDSADRAQLEAELQAIRQRSAAYRDSAGITKWRNRAAAIIEKLRR